MSRTQLLLLKMRCLSASGTAVGMLACACIATFGQNTTNTEARSQMTSMLEASLSRLPPSGSMDLTVAVRNILGMARVYGGIAVVGCADRHHMITYRSTVHAITLKEALDAVVMAAPGYKWTLSDEGAINVQPVGQLPQLLETQIQYFDWDDASPMHTALARLFDTHEVRQRKLELNISQYGFGGLAVPMRGPSETPRDWRRVEHVSVLSALNAIARSYGNGVWAYSECRSANSVDVQLVTLVQ